LRFCIDYR
jgi:hypothetical protein